MKKGKWWICCLITAMVLGVRTAHMINKTPQQGVQLCGAGVHSHVAECAGEAEALLCGYSDFVVHTHEEICYHGNGNLRCSLPQITVHVHGQGCYEPVEASSEEGLLWKQVRVCDKEALGLHTHEDTCFRDGKWECGQLQLQEHRHSPECFMEKAERKKTHAGLAEAKPSAYTLVGLIHAAVAAGLLFLQKKWENMPKERLPQQ